MSVLATLIWTPIGVWIGLRPRVARIAQPLAQIAASFPVNMTFPFIVAFFIAAHIPINWGSILLMALGTQWYILFNVIAGAMAIPTDLREAAAHVRSASLAALENADHSGDLSVLGHRRPDGDRRGVECQHRGRGRHLGQGQAGRRRPGRVHCARSPKRATSRRSISVSWSWRCSSSSSIASSGAASTTWRNASSSSTDHGNDRSAGGAGRNRSAVRGPAPSWSRRWPLTRCLPKDRGPSAGDRGAAPRTA